MGNRNLNLQRSSLIDKISHLLISIVLISAPLMATFASISPVHAQTTFDSFGVRRATVQVTQVSHAANGQPVIACVGSGTLVSVDGLILTNAHLARSSSLCKSDALLISLTVQTDPSSSAQGQPPIATYYADVVEMNLGWDLAVLRIARTLDGRAVNRGTLVLPYVALGDSETLVLDQTIQIAGYPLGDDKTNGAVSVRPATISNFTDEARVGSHAWIKTNASIAGGMSGGGAYNSAGNLIGIPTIEPSPGTAEACRLIQDTNGDGRVDGQDTCVPTGGFINALRPARLARGLVLAAQLGLRSGGAGALPPSVSSNPTAHIFDRLLTAPGVTTAGMPTTLADTFPGGTKSLYLFFDYHSMQDGLIYELRTTIDGIPNATFSLAPALWSGGSDGLWYIGGHEQVWPNGAYTFTLLIEGVRSASKQITIGGVASTVPTFSDILFGITDPTAPLGASDAPQTLLVTGNVLPTGDTIYADFVYNNVSPTTVWGQRWYYEGQPIASPTKQSWNGDANGKRQISAKSTKTNALQPGRYRIELIIDDRLAATADFVMAGGEVRSKPDIFSLPTFASDITTNKVITSSSFPKTIPHLYALFNWHDLAPGTPWTWRWTVDGNPLFEDTTLWPGAITGTGSTLVIDSDGQFVDGSYTLELLVEGVSMGKASVKVGLGQLPATTFAKATGVLVQGQIVNTETKKGIAGASFIVLVDTVSTKDFNGSAADIAQMVITDSEGRFQLTKLLTRGTAYSVLVIAHGYLTLSTDSLTIDDKTKNPLVLSFEMNKD